MALWFRELALERARTDLGSTPRKYCYGQVFPNTVACYRMFSKFRKMFSDSSTEKICRPMKILLWINLIFCFLYVLPVFWWQDHSTLVMFANNFITFTLSTRIRDIHRVFLHLPPLYFDKTLQNKRQYIFTFLKGSFQTLSKSHWNLYKNLKCERTLRE